MDDMLTMQTPATDDPFLGQGWTGKADGNPSAGASSPFPFDLHICDYSGGTPISLPLSIAATPAYSDVANPFFSDFEARKVPAGLQPAFMGEHAREEEDNEFLGNEATYRKRALQRLSLTSSVVSSAPSTAPSETEEDANESDWDSLSIKRSDSSTGDQFDALDCSLYSAFTSHSLAGPCSFKSDTIDSNNSLVHAQSNGTIRAANRTFDGASDRRGHHAPAASIFNLADFISDTEQSPEAMPAACAPASAPASTNGDDVSKFQAEGNGTTGHAPEAALIKVEHYGLAHQQCLSAGATPTRLGARLGAMDLAATSPHQPMSSVPSVGAVTSLPPHIPLATAFHGVHAMGAVSSAVGHGELHMPPQQRSMSFNGRAVHAHPMATPERPLLHPSLVRVGRQETPPNRSYSTPNIHDPLSCNPAYITPTSAGCGSSSNVLAATPGSPSPAFAQNLFGGADFPDSPASSVLSSPPHWACALSGDDMQGEETYCASNASLMSSALSSSLPSRPSSTRSFSDVCSVPASPSGRAGQPMRPVRSTSGAAPASPYASPAYGSPISGQHLLPPSHPLAHLQDPYSGVITKRSRGRRVPSTPEEMTNIGKSGKVYTCKVPGCGKLFKRSEHLKRHIRSIHTNEKPYVCQICRKQFSRHDNLNQHMRVHGSGAGSETTASSSGGSPAGSPMSRSPSAASRRGSSSHPFHETRGGTITRRHLNLTDEGVFDFEPAD